MDRPLRVANFSGFYGDRAGALAEMFRHADADVLTGDYLAEVTMSVLAALRRRDPDAGYAAGFLSHLRPVLDQLQPGGPRIVVNAGGLNPPALAAAIRAEASQLSVATVTGDDVMDRLDDVSPTPSFEPLTANAYLGGWGIARALEDGAQIVVTGRVADASLVIGASAWWHRWDRNDWDALAGALIAGHVIECGAQATGGNFSGFRDLDLSRPSFPVAEINHDGSAVITKLEHTTGAVTVDTVTAQLVYEIQGRWYANPDVVADLTSVNVSSAGPDRVKISGTAGAPPPPTTKVALTGVAGWENSLWVGLTGLDFAAKAAVLEQALRAALAAVDGIEELGFTVLGHQADDATTQDEATGFLRITAHGHDERAVGRVFSSAVVELALGSFPGIYLTAPPGPARRRGAFAAGLIEQKTLAHRLTTDDGGELDIPAPDEFADYVLEFDPDATPEIADPETVSVHLAELVHTRSGDKGGDANIGVWPVDPGLWPWLRGHLTVERLRELLPETTDLAIHRLELPRLHALNFVIEGLLGDGAISSARVDSQAKGLGEFLRSRRVRISSTLTSPRTPARTEGTRP